MEYYIKNNISDITYPEWSFSTKYNFGIPKLYLKSYYIRGMSAQIPHLWNIQIWILILECPKVRDGLIKDGKDYPPAR